MGRAKLQREADWSEFCPVLMWLSHKKRSAAGGSDETVPRQCLSRVLLFFPWPVFKGVMTVLNDILSRFAGT